jgi:hypothetical protein
LKAVKGMNPITLNVPKKKHQNSRLTRCFTMTYSETRLAFVRTFRSYISSCLFSSAERALIFLKKF